MEQEESRNREEKMNRIMTLSGVFAVAVMLAGVGCGLESIPDEGTTAQGESAGQPGGAAGSQTAQLDYGPKPPVAGYERFGGDCRTFPYSLQHPAAWEVQASRGVSIGKTRTDDTQFGMSIREDHGSVHAANLEKTVMAQGLTEVGRIEVGGQQVRVLNMGDRYVLHTPHGAGALFHHLEVLSTLGVEETLRLLNTLEPLQEC
jgi:hypothetical protein